MDRIRIRGRIAGLVALLLAAAQAAAPADAVRMKNDLVYRGTVHHDETLVSIFDGVKKTLVRDSKVAKFETDTGLRAVESFQLDQPSDVRGGIAPNYILGLQASDWDEFGQRPISYMNGKQKMVRLTQAIVEIDPHHVKTRGTTAPWSSPLSLNQIPRPIILGLLRRVDQENENERRRVCQFLIQARWYPEAREELERLAKDFPDSIEGARNATRELLSLEASLAITEVDRLVRAQQPRAALSQLRGFPVAGATPDQLADIRTRLRAEEDRLESLHRLSAALQEDIKSLDDAQQKRWSPRLTEVLQVVQDAPEVAQARLDAYSRAREAPDSTAPGRVALAFSGWVVGTEKAVANLDTAAVFWDARTAIAGYWASRAPEESGTWLSRLTELTWTAEKGGESTPIDPDLATRIIRLLPPPRADGRDATPGQPRIVRILDDTNPGSTEYAVLLPPEYHPLRSYPVVLALHDGRGPLEGIKWWAEEATRRGYIVIAPDYLVPGQTPDYRYSASEHAAAILALRDARKRFAIDSDRVFVGGVLLGGNMAWDFGLAHPDLFAGLVSINGVPAKYVSATRGHGKLLPAYAVVGELAPGAGDVSHQFAKDQITKNFEFTHVEYQKRGLEPLPEEAPSAFDWMDRWKRVAQPKAFRVSSARLCDDRFYGVVIKEFQPNRTPMQPDGVDLLGKNIPKPPSIEMTSSLGPTGANLIMLKTEGLKRFDVWVGPDLLDFSRKMEVRVNTKPAFKGLAKPGLEPLLEDLRVRGDRQQVYWMKVPVGR